MHADLFEQPALHDGHGAAAEIQGAVATFPWCLFKPAGRTLVERRACGLLERLQAADDVRLELLEPGDCPGLAGFDQGGFGGVGHGG